MPANADRTPTEPAPTVDDVDARRRAVARASTLAELLAAHADVDAFLSSPYGVAYLAHREDVCAWDRERVRTELLELSASPGPTRR